MTVFQSDELKRRGMGGIHSVGQGSQTGRQSRMIILRLNVEYSPFKKVN